MDVYDEGGALIEEWDEARGRLDFRERAVVHRYAVESAEEGHLETVAEYPETGGRDVAWVVDEPEVGAWHTYDAGTDEEIEGYRGPVADDWPHEREVPDTYQYAVYVPYTEEELGAMAEAEAASALAATRSAQVATFAALAMPALAPTISDSRAAEVSALAPDYVPEGHEYKAGEVFRTSDGGLWRVSQDFTSLLPHRACTGRRHRVGAAPRVIRRGGHGRPAPLPGRRRPRVQVPSGGQRVQPGRQPVGLGAG